MGVNAAHARSPCARRPGLAGGRPSRLTGRTGLPELASEAMPIAPNGHRVEIVRHEAPQGYSRTTYAATCADCHWIWLSREKREQAEQDVARHSRPTPTVA